MPSKFTLKDIQEVREAEDFGWFQRYESLAIEHALAMADAIEALVKVARVADCIDQCDSDVNDLNFWLPRLRGTLWDFKSGPFAGLLEDK